MTKTDQVAVDCLVSQVVDVGQQIFLFSSWCSDGHLTQLSDIYPFFHILQPFLRLGQDQIIHPEVLYWLLYVARTQLMHVLLAKRCLWLSSLQAMTFLLWTVCSTEAMVACCVMAATGVSVLYV